MATHQVFSSLENEEMKEFFKWWFIKDYILSFASLFFSAASFARLLDLLEANRKKAKYYNQTF